MKYCNFRPFCGCLVLFLLAMMPKMVSAANETLASGAFIVNMGITPQTVGNGLKPYGMIYDLAKNYAVPIKWVINPAKAKDGIDFSHGGTDFKGGPFIIEAQYRTAAVNARITYWQSLGVVGVTTTAAITVPIYNTIYTMPKWTMEKNNGGIAVGFFVNAGIPPSAHGGASSAGWKLASELTCCDDIFVMPHADPVWSTHANLYAWNLNCDGAIWLGCHAGSALEDMFNPAMPAQQTNFLAEKTGVATGGGPWSENALQLWGNHSDGTLPYSYAHHADPVMQFMGIIDAAQLNGSEQIYIPTSAGWRPTTKVGVFDPDHPDKVSTDPKHYAATLAHGIGLGDPARGEVMLEACHSINKGLLPANIAAQRAFFNFSLLSALQKALVPDPIPTLGSVNDTVVSGQPVTFTYTLPAGYFPADYTAQWSSSCGGTFSPNATQQNLTFTPPSVTGTTNCLVSVQLSDICGDKFTSSQPLVVLCSLTATATTTNPTCGSSANGVISVAVTGGVSPFTYNWSRTSPAATGSGTGTTISGLIAGVYNITVTASGGCSKTLSATLTAPAGLTASNVATNVLCNGASNGAINLTAASGTTPYTYNWGGGVTAEDRSGLAAGTYSATVTDANGCTATTSATLTQPAAALSLSATMTNVACNGGSTGAIDLTPAGGTTPYTYNWGGGVTTQDRTALAAGTYVVTVTDANGCTAILSKTITQPGGMSLSTALTHASCPGATDGAINLTVSGGSSPFNYDWADVAGTSNTEDRTALAAGTYSVTVTDASGCTATISATLNTANGLPLPPIVIGH